MIVEGVYRPQAIEQMPLETQVALAVPEASGRLTIYSCTQAMYFSMGVVAAHLAGAAEQAEVRRRHGRRRLRRQGRHGDRDDLRAARAEGAPAGQVALDARGGVPRLVDARAWHIELADAVTKDGWILGRRTLTLHDSGAYARFSPYGAHEARVPPLAAPTRSRTSASTGSSCFTNRVPTTAMRGFGVTSVSFATETHLNRIADVLGIDPWELRLKNANRIGDTSGNGVVLQDPSTVPVTLAAAERVGDRAAGAASGR